MGYRYTLYESPERVEAAAWNAARTADTSPFSDLRFLQVTQTALQKEAICRPVLITDEENRPAAVACLSLFHVDGSILSGPFLQKVTGGIRKFWPNYLQLRVLLCGLPVSTGESAFFIRETADSAAVCAALKEALDAAVQEYRPVLTIGKEFPDEQAALLQPLKAEGFLQVDSLPMHEFPTHFTDFEDFLQATSKKHRYSIRKSRRKLQQAGIQTECYRGEAALPLLTAETHRLYAAVYQKSHTKFEFLPLAFFRELALQFQEEAWFIFFRRDNRILSFCCSLTYGRKAHLLFAGLDYERNREFDLYFNVIYESLARALEQKPTHIFLGQNAEDFKVRLGCRQTRRSLFVRGHGVWRPLLKTFAPFVFPRVEDLKSSHLQTAGETGNEVLADQTSPDRSAFAGRVAELVLPQTGKRG